MTDLRVVVDTNVLVSRLLVPGSTAAQAVDLAVTRGRLLMSDATLAELARVLGRAKFDRYVSVENRQQFIRHLGSIVEIVPVLRCIEVCRDPKDDAVLEVAVNGEAGFIVTGDADLRVLDPYCGIRVLSPAQWLESAPG